MFFPITSISCVVACDAGMYHIQQTLRTVQVARELLAVLHGIVGLYGGMCQYCMHVGRCPQHHIILACSCC